jgi:membrane protein involved in colicin uptake
VGVVGAVAERTRPTNVRAPGTAVPVAPPTKKGPQPGNSALSALLGGIAVQRTGCGGACGCGGTCGDEGEKAQQPEADEVLAGASVQRLHDGPSGRAPVGPPPSALLAGLQRGAGNAAVAQLVRQRQRRPPPSPSTTTAVATAGPAVDEPAVQRFDATDLLPDWITGAIFGAKDTAAAGAKKAADQGQEAERTAEKQAGEAEQKVDAQVPKLAAEAAKTAGQAEAKLAEGNSTAAKGKADMDAASAKAAKELEQAASKTQKANEGAQLLKGEQPSCSISKVMQTVEKGADILGKPFGLTGAQLLDKAGKVVSKITTNVKNGLKAIGAVVKGVKDAYNTADNWVKDKIGLDIATIGKWAMILTNPILLTMELGKQAMAGIMRGAMWAGEKLGQLASWAVKEGPRLLNAARAKVGSWIDKLPAPLINAIQAIAAPYAAVIGPIQAAGKAIGDKLRPRADKAKATTDKAVADAKAKQAEIDAKAKAEQAKKQAELKGKKAAVAGATDQKATQEAAAPKNEGEQKAADVKSAAKDESDKLSHKVCAEMDASAGQCIADYLPDPGKGNSSSISGTVTGEVTIPIPETPISAKVGQGAKVEVARTGTKSYTVAITGDAMLYANLGAGKASGADVKVDLPGGGKGNVSKVWEKLGGAGGNQPAAPAGGGGGGGMEAKGDLDMGYRAQTALVYGFTAGATNCEGLGGLVTLLGVLGIKGAGGFLGELAMLGAQESFEKNLQSRKMTIAEGVVMSGEVKNAFGKAGIKVSGEAGMTYGQERDDKGKLVDTLELFVGGSGELTGEFEHDIVSGLGAGVAASGKASVVLGYVNDPATNTEEIKVIKLKGEASATASVAATNLNKIGGVIGQSNLQKIRDLLKIGNTNLDPTMASLTGTASGEVDAGVAYRALSDLLNDPNAASVSAVTSKAKQVLKDQRTTGTASLTMTLTERLAGAGVEVEEREPGMNSGAKGSAALDRTETRLIWSSAS